MNIVKFICVQSKGTSGFIRCAAQVVIVVGIVLLNNLEGYSATQPTAKKVNPTGNQTIVVNSRILFKVICTASANLKRVDWYVDGEKDHGTAITGTSAGDRWEKGFQSEGTVKIGAICRDVKDQKAEIGWAITVGPDPEPTATKIAPTVNKNIIAGESVKFEIGCSDVGYPTWVCLMNSPR